MLLESEGYEVEVATDGEDARDKVAEFLPDLVISDVVMPRMSGFELCRHLKAQTRTASIPVVLLTALDSAQDLLRGLEAGADNFIRKPYDEDYLLSRVRRILSNLDGGSSLEQPDNPLHAALTGHKLDLTADKAQIVELLLSMVEDLSRTNEELARANRELDESRGQVAEYTANLEKMVQERNEALIRAEKVSITGELASGVVAELATPIRSMVQFAELLGARDLDEDARSYVEGIARAANHCLTITEEMLAFGHESNPRRTSLDLNEIAETTARFHASEWRDDRLELRLDLTPSLPTMQADPRQIRSMVSNLLANAREAILDSGRGGLITVSTSQSGGKAILTIEDDGPGMPPEVLRQAFEPFYSTRPQGSGMGLSLCQAIVHRHGGTIRLEPRPGGGTRAVVELSFVPRQETPA